MYFFPKFVDITMIYFEQHLSMMVFSSWVIAGVRAVYTVGVNSSPSVVSTWGSNDRSVITRSDHIGGGGGILSSTFQQHFLLRCIHLYMVWNELQVWSLHVFSATASLLLHFTATLWNISQVWNDTFLFLRFCCWWPHAMLLYGVFRFVLL